jgi:glutaredoxin
VSVSPQARALVGADPVVVLSASWCGYCRRLKDDLQRAGVAYREFDVETSGIGERAYELVGAHGIPVTLIGTAVVHGYKPQRVIALAQEAGVATAR